MKLRFFNCLSAICFLISSITILLIPLLNINNEFNYYAYFIAGVFWFFILLGIGVQIFLFIKTRKIKSNNPFKLYKIICFVLILFSFIMIFFVMKFLITNSIILPINLFILLISVGYLSIIFRMEKLL